MMLPTIRYRSPELRQSLIEWSQGRSAADMESPWAAYEEHLAEWCGSHYDVAALMVEAIKLDRDVMTVFVSSDGWSGQKEIALLPDGSLAW